MPIVALVISFSFFLFFLFPFSFFLFWAPAMRRLLSGFLVVVAAATARGDDFDAKTIDAEVEKARAFFDVPGCAAAIVKDDKVVYLKGFGTRTVGGKEVTPDTLFPIASCTKAFTATAAAALVAEGKMAWDDPVRKHLPWFRLDDGTADREVTVRDLLTHRTGLPRHDLLWHQPGWSREELVRRSAFVPASKGFRAEWQYNNLMFIAAGLAVGNAAGVAWEDVVRTRLLDPLGMTNSNFRVAETQKSDDFAKPHLRKAPGKVEEIPFFPLDATCPAGGLNSSARELTHWVRFQLAGGKLGDKRVLPAAAIAATHAPVAVTVPLPVRAVTEEYTVNANYALGWFVADYRGLKLVHHGGSIDGFTSFVLLVPRSNIGIVVLNNRHRSPLPFAVGYRIIDLLHTLPDVDWNRRHQDAIEGLEKLLDAENEKRVAKRKPGTHPSVPAKAVAGTYDHPGYGPLTFAADGDKLTMKYAVYTETLEHFHYDTYHIPKQTGLWPYMWQDGQATFRLGSDGRVAGVEFLGVEFKRKG